MAKFKIREKKQMPKRDDGLASTYNKQAREDYEKTNRHIQRNWHWLLEHAVNRGEPEILVQPLKGFPRTRGQANYSAYDIYKDLDLQYKKGEDWLDSKIGRWNRLFEEFPDLCIEFEYEQPKNIFNEVFQ